MNLITKNLSASPLFSLMRDKGNSEGKTWLLNKLFGANLPAGKLCTTKGLSFLWIKERRMLVLLTLLACNPLSRIEHKLWTPSMMLRPPNP